MQANPDSQTTDNQLLTNNWQLRLVDQPPGGLEGNNQVILVKMPVCPPCRLPELSGFAPELAHKLLLVCDTNCHQFAGTCLIMDPLERRFLQYIQRNRNGVHAGGVRHSNTLIDHRSLYD